MINNLKINWKLILVLGLAVLVSFFLLRLVNLTILPVFADEAIYIRWSQVMRAEPTLRFLPLSDGKQPLFMWLIIPFFKVFSDPLFSGRFVSVLAGLGSLVGIFLLTLHLFSDKKIASLSAFLYSIVPFTVFFDRMALADSLLSMFGIWVLYLSILLTKYRRLDLAMIIGIVLGGALITKSPAIFFALLLPMPIIMLWSKNKKDFLLSFAKTVPLWMVSYIFAFGIYNILRLGPNFQMIALRNKDYVFPLSNVLFHPFDPFQFHIIEIFQWLNNLLTPPVFLGGLVGIIICFAGNRRVAVLLSAWLLFPLLIQAEYAKVFTARYILFVVPFYLIFVAFFLNWLADRVGKFRFKKLILVLAVVIFLFPSLAYDYLLLSNPGKAALPSREKSGYLEEWTAGQGIKEAALYLKVRAENRKVLVGTEGYFGTLPDGLQMYLEKVPNITIIGVGLYLEKVPQQLVNSTKDNEVYLLINDERLKLKPEENNLSLISRYPKAVRSDGTYQSLLLLVLK